MLTPKEYISTFINKNLRLSKRNFKEMRKFNYQYGVLETFSTSASILLGEGNKIMAVLKSKAKGHGEFLSIIKKIKYFRHCSRKFSGKPNS